MSARKTALDVLIACRQQGAWSNGVLKEYLERDGLDRRDAALATRLSYGVVQNRAKLDYSLSGLLTGKLRDLHPVARDILHLGLYQIDEMDRIPDSAAVNESVRLARAYCKGQRHIPGLVNGVLRNAVRTRDSRKQPDSLAIRYSHPQELVDLLAESVGQDRLESVLAANNGAPDTVIQVNTRKTTARDLMERLEKEGVSARAHGWMPDCLVLSGTGSLEKLSPFREGLFYVQDAAARLCVRCAELPSAPEIRVLDCCAAPGGKSFAAAMEMDGRGTIVSCDVYEHKVRLIRLGAERLGLENIRPELQDASQPRPEWVESMDVVLADVPCSGYGIIRKKPDIRYKDIHETEKLPELQEKILLQQAEYVKPGGTLLYSTCTVLRRENEEVVASFLDRRPDFERVPLRLPEGFPPNTTGMLTLLPGEYDTDGFFICRMRRKA